jgi:glycine/D-amino acid oxidase-like deaminating enzyme
MSKLSRRSLLAMLPAVSIARALSGQSPRARMKVVVVGAGAFGGWTSLFLLRRGAKVTLLDAWGPGNSRASSGGETRVIRATYGPDRIYVRMVARALELWRENEKRWNRRLYHRTGALWMAGKDDRYEKAALPLLRESGLAFEELSKAEAAGRYPQINLERVEWAIVEKDAGYLTARRACEVVLEGFLAEGGEYRQISVAPGPIEGGKLASLALSDGTRLTADAYVFACGPWLGKLFPDVVGDRIRPTRQEVFFFGTPAGDARFSEENLPVWIDHGERIFYGIPGNQWRGFKVADDTRGAPFDPTSGERVASAEGIQSARDYLAFRFPGLKGAPLLESRVCQYENSPDQQFIADRHPGASNAWIVGGGSGHGFKHGPAFGELVAANVLGEKPVEPFFSLSRFDAKT